MSEEPPKPLREALIAIMNDVRSVRKDDYSNHGNFNFRGIDAVVNAVGPALRKHGVICMPKEVHEHTLTSRPSTKGGSLNFCSVRVSYAFIGTDGNELVGQSVGEAFDSGDKSTAKAMSVALRTFLLQSLVLPTDEPDPDLDVYNEARPSQITMAVAQERVKHFIGGDVDKLRDFWREARDDGAEPGVLAFIADRAKAAQSEPAEGDVVDATEGPQNN